MNFQNNSPFSSFFNIIITNSNNLTNNDLDDNSDMDISPIAINASITLTNMQNNSNNQESNNQELNNQESNNQESNIEEDNNSGYESDQEDNDDEDEESNDDEENKEEDNEDEENKEDGQNEDEEEKEELTLDFMMTLKMQTEFEYEDNLPLTMLVRLMYNYLLNNGYRYEEVVEAMKKLYDNVDPANKDNVIYILERLHTRNNVINNQIPNGGIANNLVNMLTLFNNLNQEIEVNFNQHIDQYNNEIINPGNFFSMITNNINTAMGGETPLSPNLFTFNSNSTVNTVNPSLMQLSNNVLPVNNGNNTVISPLLGGQNYTTIPPSIYIPISPFNNLSADALSDAFSPFNVLSQILMPIGNQLNIPINANIGGLNGEVKNVTTEEILERKTKRGCYKDLDEDSKTKFKTCSICMDDYKDESDVRQLNCKHVFHRDCIDPWLLNENYKCPICRDDTLENKNGM